MTEEIQHPYRMGVVFSSVMSNQYFNHSFVGGLQKNRSYKNCLGPGAQFLTKLFFDLIGKWNKTHY